jgi:hypothetical protein
MTTSNTVRPSGSAGASVVSVDVASVVVVVAAGAAVVSVASGSGVVHAVTLMASAKSNASHRTFSTRFIDLPPLWYRAAQGGLWPMLIR